MEDARASVEQSMNDKHGPLALARSRLSVRTSKPGAEVVRDAAERSLEKEIGDLEHSIRKLQVRPPHSICKLQVPPPTCVYIRISCSNIFVSSLHVKLA